MPKKFLLFVVLPLLFNTAFAHKIENIGFQYDRTAKTMSIHYDLIGGKHNTTYTVNIYCIDKIENRELGQLQSLSGSNSYGSGVTGGKNKTVVWQLTDGLPNGLRSEIQLRIEALPEIILVQPKDTARKNYVETINGVSFTMVYVKGGSFGMGSNSGDSDEKPIHEVSLTGFYMAETEVTQELYKAVMGENPSDFRGKQKPVESVSWYDAVEFCNALSKKAGLELYYSIDKSRKDRNNKNKSDKIKWTVTTNPVGTGYHLPSEAQWEYAAGGGASGRTIYSGSDKLDEVAWHWRNANGATHPVKQKKPNQLGLYDMSGNVWEWCDDWYSSGYYTKSKGKENPVNYSGGNYRVLRSGSWFDVSYCRVADRLDWNPSYRVINFGFRIVRSVP